MDTKLFSLYSRAYAILGNITPIPADCGELCNSKCCAGDENSGMILFPGEKDFLSRADFLEVKKRDMNGFAVDFAVCKGRCARRFRPLSCRIFPLAPFWDGETLEILPDPRAEYICPLMKATDMISPEFTNAVKDAFLILVGHPDISEMLKHYTGMLREYSRFIDKKL